MESPNHHKVTFDFPFSGSGEMLALARTYPWTDSVLGDPSGWPYSLRSTVNLVLSSALPMFLAWGPQLTILYNDAYIPMLEDRHPAAFMQPMKQVWRDAWETVSGLAKEALSGRSCFLKNFEIKIERSGVTQLAWFSFSFSPIWSDDGKITGMLCIAEETTQQVRRKFSSHFVSKLRKNYAT